MAHSLVSPEQLCAFPSRHCDLLDFVGHACKVKKDVKGKKTARRIAYNLSRMQRTRFRDCRPARPFLTSPKTAMSDDVRTVFESKSEVSGPVFELLSQLAGRVHKNL